MDRRGKCRYARECVLVDQFLVGGVFAWLRALKPLLVFVLCVFYVDLWFPGPLAGSLVCSLRERVRQFSSYRPTPCFLRRVVLVYYTFGPRNAEARQCADTRAHATPRSYQHRILTQSHTYIHKDYTLVHI